VVLEEGDRKIGDRNMKGRAIFLSSRTPDIGTKFRCVVFRSFDPEVAIRVRGFCPCDALHTQRLLTPSAEKILSISRKPGVCQEVWSSIFLSWRFRFRVITSREMSLLTPSRFLTSAGLDYAIHSGLAERVLGRAGKGMLSCPVRGLELPPEWRMTNGGTG
jgi:hypothetical protein